MHACRSTLEDPTRKIETRLIVSRPDERQADGHFEPQALYGTYLWNEDETEAVLVKDKLRDGSEFADRLLTYIVDEPKAKKIRDSMPSDLSRALDDDNPGVTRRYAIPGKQRCLACHMGAENASFVLGFTPMQLNRRPLGEGGVYEPVGEDELNQLQRLIDYGVITGMAAATDALPLENSQGTRKHRNDYELKAQGYLLGNCAHCHNPRGFPSVNAPDLVEALDFLPSTKGGIFQFPLDRMSPQRKRGAKQDIPIPYITPSLRDFKSQDSLPPQIWREKFVECAPDGSTALCNKDKKDQKVQFIEAPWRSLIYRNVDSPFIYAEDFTIFPHMPRDTAGFDCRAPRVLGDWMVSIPAKRKSTKISEDEIVSPDAEPQPYVEVLPSDPTYAAEQKAAAERLDRYHKGKRYDYCPDTIDIVDHQVLKGKRLVPADEAVFSDAKRTMMVMPEEGVPDKTHFVVTDLTDAPGGWSPRRPDWATALITPAPSPRTDIDLPTILKNLTASEQLKAFVRAPFPLGVWKAKDGCDFGKHGVRKVGEIPLANQSQWMEAAKGSDAVYDVTPGEAVFQNICINCHGAQADSKGLLATAVAEMTGGDARVANFKAGLFGPAESPGKNLNTAFASFAKTHGGTAEDWAQRYMIWMALGGTKAALPSSILDIVGTTPVVGERRQGMTVVATPNMLETAQQLCVRVLGLVGVTSASVPISGYFGSKEVKWGVAGGLIQNGNGDAELWARLCSMDNRPVVRVFTASDKTKPLELLETNRHWGDTYPKDAPVMNHRGEVQTGIQPDNLAPACLFEPEGDLKAVADVLQKAPIGPQGQKIPYCPKAWINERGPDGQPKWQFVYREDTLPPNGLINISAEQWAVRGAINAGLAVFSYLQDLESCKRSATPAYNRCEDLGKATCKN